MTSGAGCLVPGAGCVRAALALFLVVSTCVVHVAAADPARRAGTLQARGTRPHQARGTRHLARDLGRIFDAPLLARSHWGILVRSLDTGKTIFSHNAAKLMMPASNMKIVTMAAAAERLGWDYRFTTTFVSDAPLADGVLQGDLVVVGSGDPSMNAHHDRAAKILEDIAWQIRTAGVRTIAGRIIAEDNAFEEREIGGGWAWDYLQYGYAAPVAALAYHENLIELRVIPGAASGEPARLEISPTTSDLVVVNHAATAPPTAEGTIDLLRERGSRTLEVTGVIAADAEPVRRTAAVENPSFSFARAVREGLIAHGIDVRGEAADRDEVMGATGATGATGAADERRILARVVSPPLWEIGSVMMKTSQNLYAEMLLKTLGREQGVGSTESGRGVISEVLEAWEIPPDSYVLADASGLSRYNYVTPEMLVSILTRMYDDPRHRDRFMATLPVAGRDGTMSRRMLKTAAEDNARAKTGSIANVRSLSGYVRTRAGEMLVFSIIANNFTVPAATVDYATDLAVSVLANSRGR